MSVVMGLAVLLAASSPAAAARSLQQTLTPAMIQNVLNAYEKNPTQTANELASRARTLPSCVVPEIDLCMFTPACMRQHRTEGPGRPCLPACQTSGVSY